MLRIEKQLLIILVILCGILAPIAFFLFSNVPTLTPVQAKDLLGMDPENTIILDVQDEESFERRRVNTSLNIFYKDILQQALTDDQMAAMKNKNVIVLCDSGLASAAVTGALRKKKESAFRQNRR